MAKRYGKTQREENPFPYSDTNKRYHTFDYYMKHRFGKKCAKIPLDAGFTCPNIDGTKGVGGCTYCLGGSAAVTAAAATIEAQFDEGVAAVRRKWKEYGTVPYLQSNSCTYADGETLRALYEKCAVLPDAVMLAVATRADCLTDEAIAVLREVSQRIPVLVELGLQTSSDATAKRINRCHTTAEFLDGYGRLRDAGGDIAICVHVINGLPGESEADMLETARFVAGIRPDVVKIHLLHVLRGTPLFEMFERGEYVPMEREDYIRVVCDQLELLPPETAVARLTGDGFARDLAAPDWSRDKMSILNDIDKELYRRRTTQSFLYIGRQAPEAIFGGDS